MVWAVQLLNSVDDPELETAWFQPLNLLNLKCLDISWFKIYFAFKWCQCNCYDVGAGVLRGGAVHTLNAVGT